MTQAFFVDAGNRFYLMLYDVMNCNDVISATDLLMFVKMYVSVMYRWWKILLSNMSRLETFGMTLVHDKKHKIVYFAVGSFLSSSNFYSCCVVLITRFNADSGSPMVKMVKVENV